jgi:hypothetical protein
VVEVVEMRLAVLEHQGKETMVAMDRQTFM